MDKRPISVVDFLHIVTRLSNSCFVRHWIKWLGPDCEGYELALCCIDWEGQPLLPYRGDIAEWDFITQPLGINTVFIFRRAPY